MVACMGYAWGCMGQVRTRTEKCKRVRRGMARANAGVRGWECGACKRILVWSADVWVFKAWHRAALMSTYNLVLLVSSKAVWRGSPARRNGCRRVRVLVLTLLLTRLAA